MKNFTQKGGLALAVVAASTGLASAQSVDTTGILAEITGAQATALTIVAAVITATFAVAFAKWIMRAK